MIINSYINTCLFPHLTFRHFGGIKLGTGGLVRAYGRIASECLKNAPTLFMKSKVILYAGVPAPLC